MFAHAYYQVLSFSIRIVIIRHYSTKFEVICSSLCFEKLISNQVRKEKTFCIGIIIELFHLIYWYFKNDYYTVIILNQLLHCCFYCNILATLHSSHLQEFVTFNSLRNFKQNLLFDPEGYVCPHFLSVMSDCLLRISE